MKQNQIPSPIIGLLSKAIPYHYSVAKIKVLFLTSNAPGDMPGGNKTEAVVDWLRVINAMSDDPYKVLGSIVDDFMERDPAAEERSYDKSEDKSAKLIEHKSKIIEALGRAGLTYHRGGVISSGGSVVTLSLIDRVKTQGLPSVEIEIKRALDDVANDPNKAAQYAGNVLEATLKAYLDKKGETYKDGDTLSELWKMSAAKMGLKAGDLDNKDLKKIVSGLHNVVDGIAHLRNTKSGAHGRSEGQHRSITIQPRHARLAIHAAHTVAAYVLELIE